MELPLTSLRNGETGVIKSISFILKGARCRHKAQSGRKMHVKTELCIKRLTDLGFTPGTSVTVVKSAPFNGPLEVCIRGSRLAIGRGMANRIILDVER
jgi:DtxR family Mn-dependent transcriptional regulator